MDEVTKLTIQNSLLRHINQRLELVNLETENKIKSTDHGKGALRELLLLIEIIQTQ